MVKTWDKYDNATMGVVVQNIKRCVLPAWKLTLPGADAASRSTLPDYVFEPGERQKPALKQRPPKVSRPIEALLCFAEDSRLSKGAGKTEEGSPDLFDKRRR